MAAGKTYTERLTTWLSLEGVPEYVSGMGSAAAATKGMAYQQMMLYMAQQRYAQQMVMTGAAILGVGVLALKVASDFEQYRAQIYAITRDQGAANRIFEDAIDIGARMPGTMKEVVQAGVTLTTYAHLTGQAAVATKDFMQGIVDLAAVHRGAEGIIDPRRIASAVTMFLAGRSQLLATIPTLRQAVYAAGFKPEMTAPERMAIVLKLMKDSAGAAALQVKTLGGAVSNLRDVIVRVSASLMSPLLPAFTTAMRTAEAFGKALMWLPGPVKGLIGATGLLAGSTAVLTGTIIALRAAYHIALQEMTLWTGATGAATGAQAGLAAATGIGGMAAAGAGVSRNMVSGVRAGLMRVTGLDWMLARWKQAFRPLVTRFQGRPTDIIGMGGQLALPFLRNPRWVQGILPGFSPPQGMFPVLGPPAQRIFSVLKTGVTGLAAFLGPWGLLAAGVSVVGVGLMKWSEHIRKAHKAAARMQRDIIRGAQTLARDIKGLMAQGEYETAYTKARGIREGLEKALKKAESAYKYAQSRHSQAYPSAPGMAPTVTIIPPSERAAGEARRKIWGIQELLETARQKEQEVWEAWKSGKPMGAAGGGDDLFSKLARKVIGGGSEFEKAISPLAAFKATGVMPWTQPKKIAVIELRLSPDIEGRITKNSTDMAFEFVRQAVSG